MNFWDLDSEKKILLGLMVFIISWLIIGAVFLIWWGMWRVEKRKNPDLKPTKGGDSTISLLAMFPGFSTLIFLGAIPAFLLAVIPGLIAMRICKLYRPIPKQVEEIEAQDS